MEAFLQVLNVSIARKRLVGLNGLKNMKVIMVKNNYFDYLKLLIYLNRLKDILMLIKLNTQITKLNTQIKHTKQHTKKCGNTHTLKKNQ